jgi:hypothetical protein
MDNSNPFDPEKLRLSQNYSELTGTVKLLTTVPVRKPEKTEWFRVHPDASMRLEPVAVLEFKAERETYLVLPQLVRLVSNEARQVTLFTAVNRAGVTFIWPVPLPGPDGRTNRWHESGREEAGLGMRQWIRMVANMQLGAYEVTTASVAMPEPQWPSVGFGELLQIAFKDRLLDRDDHPVLLGLRGER